MQKSPTPFDPNTATVGDDPHLTPPIPLPLLHPTSECFRLQIHDLTLVPTELAGYRNKTSKSARIRTETKGENAEGKVPRALTAMRSRSHQGMLSPPVKKLPTDSKKRSILASIDLLLSAGGRSGSEEVAEQGEGYSRLRVQGWAWNRRRKSGDSRSARSLRTPRGGKWKMEDSSRVFVTDMWDHRL